MTGGQPHDGPLTVPMITQQMAAEGVQKIVVVTDEPEKYPKEAGFADGVTVHHRDELDRIQLELREHAGVSVMVYDQTCASEKRRKRKRNTAEKTYFPDPARRVVINELVCEGCGDCNLKSNCLSVEPLETEFGRKRKINRIDGAYGIVVTGVGGTGVVTIGQLLGMAAHLEGKGISVLDMAGLAQKRRSGVLARADRANAGRSLRNPHRDGRGRSCSWMRSDRYDQQRSVVQDQGGCDEGSGQLGRIADGRFRAPAQLAARQSESGDADT